ncbi:ATP-binding cassette domain-containing protein [Streptomyces sp. NPDC057717]|uniref:ATP-binding cassette domain-containing protein n=1 Tax=Streptomyces sp. NPDC057717 TaxID=3346224 RepID=UPI00368F672B
MSAVAESGATTRPPLVRIAGVDKHFGDVQVLHCVDLDVAAGEVVAIIGPSGSGKSALRPPTEAPLQHQPHHRDRPGRSRPSPRIWVLRVGKVLVAVMSLPSGPRK